MQCPKCKEEISDNSKFCSNCGINIKEYLEKLEEENYIYKLSASVIWAILGKYTNILPLMAIFGC